ncbi:hypothetical protein ACIQU4_28695 [Streptomyces sp. NPDC090741]|uniref:hypothetical protein n=1 Tax=Streptomyces sp. NPDC090741 TaxID=3365967 RepID=UPI003802E667
MLRRFFSTKEASVAIAHAEFHPVIVDNSPKTKTGQPNQHLPEGVGPDAVRIVRAADVRPGDWYLGTCQQPSPSGSGLRYSTYLPIGYSSTPRLRKWRKKVAIDGTNYRLRADDLVIVVPRHLIPEDDWMGESFIWEPGDLQSS